MIAIVLVYDYTREAVAVCWDDDARCAWMSDRVEASALLGEAGEKSYGVIELRRSLQLEGQPIDNASAFAASLRAHGLMHAARPVCLAKVFVLRLLGNGEGICASLARMAETQALRELPAVVRDTLAFLDAFFAGIPQSEQDRLIYHRLPVFGIPF